MNPIERFAAFLIENAGSISQEIVDFNIQKLEIELPPEVIEKSVRTNKEFLEFLGESLESPLDMVTEKFMNWHHGAENQTDTNYGLEEISSLIKPYAESRLQLINILTQISIKQGLSTEEVVFVNSRANYLLDLSISEIILKRERLADSLHKKNQAAIIELSSPIVPIQNGMAVLPLIGELNLDRTVFIMNKVIPKINELKIDQLIIDFSGIVTIDNEVASRILSIYTVLDLLGIDTVFSGIRPELSRKIITAGIDFSNVKTYGTVQQAILRKI